MTNDFGEPWKSVTPDWFIPPEIAARIIACVNACAGIPTEELGYGRLAFLEELLEDQANQSRRSV